LAVNDKLEIFRPNLGREGIDSGRLRVLYEDEDLLVVAKPPGLPSQVPPRGGDALSVRVRTYLRAPPDEAKKPAKDRAVGDLHRLDRDASGLVVYGKRKRATSKLAAAFREHRVTRSYLAIVRTGVSVVDQAICEPLVRCKDGRSRCSSTGLVAETNIIALDFDRERDAALLGARLKTGRTHQIRAHLAWAVGAIAGDGLYGDPAVGAGPRGAGRIGLHAAELAFAHPAGGKRVRVYDPPGEDFWALLPNASLSVPERWWERWREGES